MAANDKTILSGNDFHDKFDPKEYLEMYNQGFSAYSTNLPNFYLRHFHEAFKELHGHELSVLDFGSGPTVLGGVSAALKSSEIIFSDYTEPNRQAANKWLEKDPTAFDWTPYFRYVIQDLEGKGQEEIETREEQIRKVAKTVIECDINRDPPLPTGYNRVYDVVICCLVLECATQTRDEYVAGMNRLGKLVKPGGLLLYVGVERSKDVGFFLLGDKKFQSLGVSSEFAVETMQDAGMSVLILDKLAAKNKDDGVVNYIFMKGQKSHLAGECK